MSHGTGSASSRPSHHLARSVSDSQPDVIVRRSGRSAEAAANRAAVRPCRPSRRCRWRGRAGGRAAAAAVRGCAGVRRGVVGDEVDGDSAVRVTSAHLVAVGTARRFSSRAACSTCGAGCGAGPGPWAGVRGSRAGRGGRRAAGGSDRCQVADRAQGYGPGAAQAGREHGVAPDRTGAAGAALLPRLGAGAEGGHGGGHAGKAPPTGGEIVGKAPPTGGEVVGKAPPAGGRISKPRPRAAGSWASWGS